MTELKKHLVDILASGLYSGKSPVASGTAGSIVAAGLIYISWIWCPCVNSFLSACILAVVVTALAWPITHYALEWQIYGADNKDPKQVVIDEWAGMAVSAVWCPLDYRALILAFFLFRIFDVLKPYPVNKIEELPGASGVLFDDVTAGLMAAGLGYAIWSFIF